MESYDVLKNRNMDTHEINEKEVNSKLTLIEALNIELWIYFAISIHLSLYNHVTCYKDTGLQLHIYSSILDK